MLAVSASSRWVAGFRRAAGVLGVLSLMASVAVGAPPRALASVGSGSLPAPAATQDPAAGDVIYDSTVSPLPGNLPSEGPEAYSFAEFGDQVSFAGASRGLASVVVTMSSWGCQSGSWTGTGNACATTPGATFSLPITLNLYNVGAANAVGSLIGTVTQSFAIPYRPSADPVNCPATPNKWYSSADHTCYNGLAYDITFDLSAVHGTMPDKVIFGIAYNTSHHGKQPIGQSAPCYASVGGCPYDSLNIALAPSVQVGSQVNPDTVYQDSTWAGNYCDNGDGGTGTFRLDSPGNACWGGLVPAVRFETQAACTTDCYVNASTGSDTASGADATHPMRTIQAAVNRVAAGGTIHVSAGTYVENVDVLKPATIIGAGQDQTIVEPSISNPNPCSGSSLCGSGTAASNVFLVDADNVRISGLTVEGDNPALTSTINAGGANIDARNGIVANFYSDGLKNGFEVDHVAVRNVYFRGIYTGTGGTFSFHDDTVSNVQVDPSSIAIFNYGGSGTIANNHVSAANDAISANHSRGTQFLGNTITGSASGVHTDNAGDGGGTADTIAGNSVGSCTSGGYGVWVFVPYIAPSVHDNTVSGCSVGLGAFGGAFAPEATVTTTFSQNSVDGKGLADSIGIYVWTGTFGWGNTDVKANFLYNTITGNATGVQVDESKDTYYSGTPDAATATATFSRNSIAGNATIGMTSNTASTVDATCNWWGNVNGPGTVGPGTGDKVSAGVTFDHWLLNTTISGYCGGTMPPTVSLGAAADVTTLNETAGATFSAAHSPMTAVNVGEDNSDQALADLMAGKTQVALISRPLNSSEKTSLYAWQFASDAMVFAVQDSPTMSFISNLTTAQVRGIYGGSIANWSALGGPNQALVARSDGLASDARSDLLRLFGIGDTAEQAVVASTGQPRLATPADAAQAAIANPYQLVYTSLAQAKHSGLKVLTLDGIAPTVLNVENASYPAIRTCYVAMRKDSFAGEAPSTDPMIVTAQDYVNWLLSSQGQTAVTQNDLAQVAVPTVPPIPDWDVNTDGGVGLGDVGRILSHWAQTSNVPGWIRADINNDGAIGLGDVGVLLSHWAGTGFIRPN